MVHSSKSHPTRLRLKNHGLIELQSFIKLLASQTGFKGPTSLSSLKNYEVNPHDYNSPDLFRIDYLFMNIVRKFAHHESNIDRKQVAYDSFYEAEAKCKRINEQGYSLRSKSLLTSFDCETLISSARRKIEYILGSSPDLERIIQFSEYSSGASVKHKRVEGDQYYKFSAKPNVTLNASMRFRDWYKGTLYERLHPILEIAPYAKSACVPKSWKTDRLICIEPHGNMYMQKGIGSYIRRMLKKVNIDLNDQSINQEYARLGSIDGKLSTIDLKAASDSISIKLVRDLVPWDWFILFMETRSEVVKLPDGLHELEKISAMGNGFTFELESLIFFALVDAVREIYGTTSDTVSVYGDDIICHTEYSTEVIDLLYYVGFETNLDKTFVSSDFRESCGKHYFSGVDVTPFYIKQSLTHSQTITLAANSLRIWCQGDSSLKGSYDYLVSLLPRWLRKPKLPMGYGDEALIGTFEEVRPKFCKKLFSFRTSRVPVIRSKYRPYKNPNGFLLSNLYDDIDGEPISLSECSNFGNVKFGQNVASVERRYVTFWADPPMWV